MKKQLIVAIFLVLGASACVNMQNNSTLDNIQKSLQGKNGSKPYVEAYVEYRGPGDKWAGPATFLMHVVAKDASPAQITMIPSAWGAEKDAGPTTAGRAPASATEKKPMSGDVAREHLSKLATELSGADVAFTGCLSPVRVRLVRADGALLEKQGCRNQDGWPRAVSETVSQFMTR